MRLTSLSFEEWVRHVFDPGVTAPGRHLDLDAPYWDGRPDVTLAYLTRLFADPRPALDRYADPVLSQGLWYLLGATGHNSGRPFRAAFLRALRPDRVHPLRRTSATVEQVVRRFPRRTCHRAEAHRARTVVLACRLGSAEIRRAGDAGAALGGDG